MSYAKQTVVELRKEVAARGLSSSGLKKADLVNLLLENDETGIPLLPLLLLFLLLTLIHFDSPSITSQHFPFFLFIYI